MTAGGAWRLILDPFAGDGGSAGSVARGASGTPSAPQPPTALPGALNMAVDQALLASARGGGAPVLRLYRWAPHAISFGRNEPARGHYDAGAAAVRGLDLVRRPTGGLAVHHGVELTYAVVGRIADLGGPRGAYVRINQALVGGLQEAGVPAELAAGATRIPVAEPGPCFALPAAGEVVCGGRKLVGSAQRREGSALLQHGSILLAGDQSAVVRLRLYGAAAPSPGASKEAAGSWIEAQGAAAGPSPGSTTVAELLGRPVAAQELVAPLAAAFEAVFGTRLAPGTLDSTERERACALVPHFSSADWTWRR